MSESNLTVEPAITTRLPLEAASAEAYPYLQGLRALPTLPSALFHFLGLIADPAASEQQLAAFIWKDPALLARVISTMNFHSSERSFPANYLQQAIASLDRGYIRSLAYTTPLLCSFEPWKPAFCSVLFWERSLLCANACQALARQLRLPAPEQYYVAGLLHDIGYLVFLQKKPEALATVLERWAAQPAQLLEIERQVMGINHCRLGLAVGRKLNLDSWMLPAIAHHHTPARDSDWFTRITSIGSAFCNWKGRDFFPSRTLARNDWRQEMEEILNVLLPPTARQNSAQLLEAMESCVPPVRKWIAELLQEPAGNTHRAELSFDPPRAKIAAAAACS
ncbi:MAG: HDOD domain-containing protein [Acidobacteria bacterium]|nr:HDOD domain-containing protein [Acidobacteriota bacterium]